MNYSKEKQRKKKQEQDELEFKRQQALRQAQAQEEREYVEQQALRQAQEQQTLKQKEQVHELNCKFRFSINDNCSNKNELIETKKTQGTRNLSCSITLFKIFTCSKNDIFEQNYKGKQ